MAQETVAYVGLGSNLGDRSAFLQEAVQGLNAVSEVQVLRMSSLREVSSLGHDDQPAYLNGVVEIRTSLSVHDFFRQLMTIEQALGRQRSSHWCARTIDLDLLLFGDQVLDEPELKVPHVQLALRHFVLEPLAELVPCLSLPGQSVTVQELVDRLQGVSFIRASQPAALISVAGNIGVGKTTLTERLAAQLGADILYEPYDSNPFLAEVYAGQQALALDSQLYFLAKRAEQLAEEAMTPGRVFVSDYVFDKEQIYAHQLLNGPQLDLYERLYRPLARQVMQPTVVLYLRDETAGCLDRIRQRGRVYEQDIQPEFLAALDHAYETLFSQWRQSPVIRLAVPGFDCLREADVADLVCQLLLYIDGRGEAQTPLSKENSHGRH